MEDFIEQVVVRRRNAALYAVLYGISWLLVAALGIFALTQLSQIRGGGAEGTDWVAVFLFLTGGLAAFGVYRGKEYLRTEFEYAFTAGELDVDRVLGNSRRRHEITVRLRDVEAGGLAEGERYRQLCSMPGVVKKRYVLNGDAGVRYLYFVHSGRRVLLEMEPSDELWAAVAASCDGKIER